MECCCLGRQRCQECSRRVRRVEPSEANSASPRPAPLRLAQPCPVPSRLAPPRPEYVRVLDPADLHGISFVCAHALREKDLQRQIGVGTQVSSLKTKSASRPASPHPAMKSASRPAGTIVTWSRPALVELHKANNLQQPSGLLNDSAKEFLIPNGSSAPNGSVNLNIPGHALHDLSSPKPGHTTGESRRGARRDGRAG